VIYEKQKFAVPAQLLGLAGSVFDTCEHTAEEQRPKKGEVYVIGHHLFVGVDKITQGAAPLGRHVEERQSVKDESAAGCKAWGKYDVLPTKSRVRCAAC